MLCEINDWLVKMRLRRITRDSLLFFYYPMKGASCYVLFAGHIMNPSILSSNFPIPRPVPISNSALAHAHVGLAMFLYGSRHLRHQSVSRRVTFSVFGSVLFNMGSVLLFAILRQATPECATLRALVGMTSAVGLLAVGGRYVQLLDRQAVIHDAETQS